MTGPKRGTRFTHRHLLDPDWTAGPGQRYTDGPGAACVVTSERRGRVYYRYAQDSEHGAAFSMPRETWDRDYSQENEQ